MSGTTKEWVSRELKRLAEDEQHGVQDFVYDSMTQRHGGVYAQENIDRRIPNKTLPPVRRETARIIRVLEDILESEDNAVLQEGADRLENIILSYSAEKRFGIYLNVVEIILDAAKFVDEQGASMKLAQLVSALAFRDDLINSTGAELTYEIGDFWKRPVTIQPDAPLTGEGGDRIWSQMPSLQLWIREALDTHPRVDSTEFNREVWEGNSWQNFTRFCGILSDMYIRGQSLVSSLDSVTVLRYLFLGVEEINSTHAWREQAAVYMSIFGHEIHRLCQYGQEAVYEHTSSNANDDDGFYSIGRWNKWHATYKRRAVSAKDEQERLWAIKALARMDEVQDAETAYWEHRTLD
ncbi:uncharacterized protein K489DRAFT_385426 [Dissoconium aciculare CBS 342.82]|uniref:Uncharacterized protein n=1 Tax=Dissoconium aciculare CBS 342.82 TaxID=1314786 RepID=A0A6J3LQN0_9PEZI|nr:uncharacterized protein K489DRAFT_385426 [Dissoconium aciculare CBS 342.82]KAF1817938.1 hypothetical protein K489DRAFT_385426 [Dissoconium aciculare CBS 342.82]